MRSKELVDGDGPHREKPRSRFDLLKEWAVKHKRWAAVILGWFFAVNLILNGLIATHLYIYQLEIYGSEAFEQVESWALVLDSLVWIALLVLLWKPETLSRFFKSPA